MRTTAPQCILPSLIRSDVGASARGVNSLNALIATIFTPLSAPVIAATRLRAGATNSVRGAAKLLADALATAPWPPRSA